MELLIGSHVSFLKDNQLFGSVEEAISYGANAFMFYTGAPQSTNRSIIDNDLTNKAIALMKKHNIDINNVIVHAPYIINLANNIKEDLYYFSIQFLKEEIKRCELMGINKIIVHPGNHVGLGISKGIDNIVNALNQIIKPEQKVIICLELMSGKGSECGSNFKELKQIIDKVKYNTKLGICLDTCHLNDAGYDLNDIDSIILEFDNIIGLDKLEVIHINDSKNKINSHKDRHENIGYGSIDFNVLIKIIYHSKIKHIPKILETPYITNSESSANKLYPPYKFEIEMIKNKKLNTNLFNDIRNYYQKKE